MLFLPLVLCNILLFIITNRFVKDKLFSPIYIQSMVIILNVFLAFLYYYFIDDKIDLFGFDSIDEDLFLEPLAYYSMCLNGMFVGFLLYYSLLRKSDKSYFKIGIDSGQINILSKFSLFNKEVLVSTSLLVINIALLFMVYGNGFWERDGYFPEGSSHILEIILAIESLFFIGSCSLLYIKKPNLSKFQMLIFLIANITTASRKVFVFYLFYILITYFLGKKNIRNKLSLFISILFSLVILAYILTLRAFPEHGLIPYITNYDIALEKMADSFFFIIYYISFFSYFVTANVMDAYVDYFSWSNFVVSMNPLPGFLAGWYDISLELNFGTYIPYNTFGEIFSSGLFFTFIFYGFIGAAYGAIEKNIRKYYSSGNAMLAIALFVIIVISILFSHQYNLRASMRPIYYSMAIIFIFNLYKFVTKKS